MPQFRKKPVVIEAFEFKDQSNTHPDVPDWFTVAVLARVIVARPDHLSIRTLEGMMRANVGDWIIRGVQGEIYPCKPDIFAETYDDPSDEIDRDNAEFNKGVTHTVELLAKAIGATGWVAGDGSEDYDEDLQQTLMNILIAKGLYDADFGTFPQRSTGMAAAAVLDVARTALLNIERLSEEARANITRLLERSIA